jgi:hypothetical protein
MITACFRKAYVLSYRFELNSTEWQKENWMKAIVSDIQLWIPVGVLLAGVVLLIALH